MKKNLLILLFLFSFSLCAKESLEEKTKKIEEFLKEYPVAYQDIIVNNQTVLTGTCRCPERYKLLQPILKSYQGKEFSVLDIGAAQGYFSFKIAYDFPHSHCTMMEGGYGQGLYADYPDRLLKLCGLNNNLKHITFLRKQLVMQDLIYLNQQEHFDVVLAFLVMHLFPEVDYNNTHEERKNSNQKILDTVLQLGDNVIIEVVPARGYKEFVQMATSKYDGVCLGQVMRDYSSPKRLGVLWLFKNKKAVSKHTLEVSSETYNHFVGVYPRG